MLKTIFYPLLTLTMGSFLIWTASQIIELKVQTAIISTKIENILNMDCYNCQQKTSKKQEIVKNMRE